MHTTATAGPAGSRSSEGDGSWRIRRTAADLDRLGETESIFALSNGWIGWRGTLDEGAPYGMPGSYLNGFHERAELGFPEDGYAFPEFSDTVVSAPNATLIRLWVDGEPLDVRTGTLRTHETVELWHHGEQVRVAGGAPVSGAMPPVPDPGPEPPSPPGRRPARRAAG
ncbi:hypothetical protein AB0C04_02190 [Micromonospora sp. NPDC048909]|uniref:hypothetical protein n=1 Tax=Micromonospora sp. NPDC048909 TaxID=3155643 RepID=UPI0033CC393E